jgi:hypothetical protein
MVADGEWVCCALLPHTLYICSISNVCGTGVITSVEREREREEILPLICFLDFSIYLQSVEIHSANGVLASEGG